MIAQAIGILKWPIDQTLRTDVNWVLLALDEHWKMVKAIFGAPDPKPTKPKGATVEQWLGMARRHNLRYQRRSRPVPPARRAGGNG